VPSKLDNVGRIRMQSLERQVEGSGAPVGIEAVMGDEE